MQVEVEKIRDVLSHAERIEKPSGTWPALEPIPDEVDATPDAFPFHALGHILGNAARAIAEDVQAPDSLAGGSVLAAASLAVQPLANVMLPHVNVRRSVFSC